MFHRAPSFLRLPFDEIKVPCIIAPLISKGCKSPPEESKHKNGAQPRKKGKIRRGNKGMCKRALRGNAGSSRVLMLFFLLQLSNTTPIPARNPLRECYIPSRCDSGTNLPVNPVPQQTQVHAVSKSQPSPYIFQST